MSYFTPHLVLLTLLGPSALAQDVAQPFAGSAANRPATWSTFWWSDYDSDGHADALVLQPGGRGQLLHNLGQGSFQDVTESAGLSGTSGVHMALWQDYDGDGRSDLFLASYGAASRLMRQARPGIFVDVTEQVGLSPALNPIDAEWIDYDSDALVDLRLSTLERDWLFRQQSPGLFQRVDLGPAERELETGGGTQLPASVDEARRLRATGLGVGALLDELASQEEGDPRGDSSENTGDDAGTAGACAPGLDDQAFPGQCIPASSVPTLGSLYPLSDKFFIRASNGQIGVGTTNPGVLFDVVGGSIRTTGRLMSTTTSQAPLTVSSNIRVDNLNADLLDGLDSTAFSQLGSLIEANELAANAVNSSKISNGSVALADLAADSVDATKIRAAAVGTAEIADGSIRDADVMSAAGIAGTKIQPSFGTQDLTTLGNVGLGAAPIPSVKLNVSGAALVTTNQNGVVALQVQHTGTGSAGLFTGTGGPGLVSATLASGYSGIQCTAISASGNGVLGINTSLSGSPAAGVRGTTQSFGGAAIYGLNTNSAVPSTTAGGVLGESANANGYGVWGRAYNGNGWHIGTGGEASNTQGYGVYSAGNLAAAGSKSFLQPHPTDPTKEIRFACLEGNESGTYFRGRAELVGGLAIIEVPEDFRLASEAAELTVQVTAKGYTPYIFVESESLQRIVVRGGADVAFDYFVNGVRRGYADFETITDNTAYRPRFRGEVFGRQYPEEIRQILMQNGILNADGTPNEALAAALGWTLSDRPEQSLGAPLSEAGTGGGL